MKKDGYDNSTVNLEFAHYYLIQMTQVKRLEFVLIREQ